MQCICANYFHAYIHVCHDLHCVFTQVLLITIVVHVHYKPFVDMQANQLGVVSLMVNTITLFAALLIKVNCNMT
jgi:hypothetical protein